jgi:hypothetical protein
MHRRLAFAALIALYASQAARADITIRRAMSVTFGSFLPPEMQAQVQGQMASFIPPENILRIRGDKSYASAGKLIAITEGGSNRVTLLNPATKQYATGSLADYLGRTAASAQAATQSLAALPPEAQQIFQSMKFDVQTNKTGQTSTIQGILAEETVMNLTMSMSMGQAVMPAMRMEMHIWTAQPDELARVGGLKEFADYTARNQSAQDPTEALSKIFGQIPGLGDKFRDVFAQLANKNGGLMLKMSASVYAPVMAQALRQAGQAPAGFDPNAPLAEIHNDLTQLSTATIDDALFTVPADYQSAPLEDLIKAMLPAIPQPPAVK